MPKKSGLMNERERGICARIKEVRLGLGLSQPAFAAKVGGTLDQLASLEYARVPLRYSWGSWISQCFDVNQRWLATGEKPKDYHVALGPEEIMTVPPNMLYSVAYDSVLRPFVETDLKRLAKKIGCSIANIKGTDAHEATPRGIERMSPETFNLIVSRSMRGAAASLPRSLYMQFYSRLNGVVRVLEKENKSLIEKFRHEQSKAKSKPE